MSKYLTHRDVRIFLSLTTLWSKQNGMFLLIQPVLSLFSPVKKGKQKWLPWKVTNTTDCYLLICHSILHGKKEQQQFILKVEFQTCSGITSRRAFAVHQLPRNSRKRHNSNSGQLPSGTPHLYTLSQCFFAHRPMRQSHQYYTSPGTKK